ncbi:hypothetical protein CL629_03335 [bacterium]|nr:hypothetical protein [bacterium]|tara:strand:- start:1790 stop:2905 length:1116 start_codon:yes stop_codon:yes gene_type:complete
MKQGVIIILAIAILVIGGALWLNLQPSEDGNVPTGGGTAVSPYDFNASGCVGDAGDLAELQVLCPSDGSGCDVLGETDPIQAALAFAEAMNQYPCAPGVSAFPQYPLSADLSRSLAQANGPNTGIASTSMDLFLFSTSSRVVRSGEQNVPLFGFYVRPLGGDLGVTSVFVRATSTRGTLDRNDIDVRGLKLYDDGNNLMIFEVDSTIYYGGQRGGPSDGFGVNFVPPYGIGLPEYELVQLGETEMFVLRGDIGADAAPGDSYAFSLAGVTATIGDMDMTNADNLIDGPGSYEEIPNVDLSVQIHVAYNGDIDLDGCVNLIDLVNVARVFGQAVLSGADGNSPRQDVNGDGTINIIDLATVGKDFGQGAMCR